jgi:hypothetical protein
MLTSLQVLCEILAPLGPAIEQEGSDAVDWPVEPPELAITV